MTERPSPEVSVPAPADAGAHPEDEFRRLWAASRFAIEAELAAARADALGVGAIGRWVRARIARRWPAGQSASPSLRNGE